MLRVGLIGGLYARPAVIPVRAAKALVSNSNDALLKLDKNLLELKVGSYLFASIADGRMMVVASWTTTGED